MKLFSRNTGEGEASLIILHGLLGSSVNWQSLAKRFGQNRTVYSLDLRNHGHSPWSNDTQYSTMASDVLEFINGIQTKRLHLLGHSMGGKVAMMLALNNPSLIDKLIIADIAPVDYEHDFSHLIKPMLALDLNAIQTRKQADVALQVYVTEPGIRAFLLHNLEYKKETKQWRWRPNLKVLLDNMPLITAFDTPNSTFHKPALFITGARSDYVKPEYHSQIKSLFPESQFNQIPNAGHWLHAEQPSDFISACESFI